MSNTQTCSQVGEPSGPSCSILDGFLPWARPLWAGTGEAGEPWPGAAECTFPPFCLFASSVFRLSPLALFRLIALPSLFLFLEGTFSFLLRKARVYILPFPLSDKKPLARLPLFFCCKSPTFLQPPNPIFQNLSILQIARNLRPNFFFGARVPDRIVLLCLFDIINFL